MRQTNLILAFLVTMTSAVFGETQKVHFLVHVPASTGAADSVYIAGSLPSVGAWKAAGVKLNRQENGTYAVDADIETGQQLEYKFTRGSWETVEKTADGNEVANRKASIDANTRQIEVTVERWADGQAAAAQGTEPAKASTVVGELSILKIESAALKSKRTIRVWLPGNYQTEMETRFPVLYMQDGQNCFDQATSAFGQEWEIDESLTKLIASKAIPPIVVVGIDNGQGDRIREYTYVADPALGGGNGENYAKFLLEEVKPFVEKTYRVKTGAASTFIGGSSLGGLVSLEIARRHADTFGGVLAMSPSVFRIGQSLLDDLEKDAGGLGKAKVWIDMGSSETGDFANGENPESLNRRVLDSVKKLDQILSQQKIVHKLLVAEGAGHNETAWAKRFPEAITYLLRSK